jgi:hypothetical protein
MKGQNDGSTYEVRITATTKKASNGRSVEEFAWSDMVANGAPRVLDVQPTPTARRWNVSECTPASWSTSIRTGLASSPTTVAEAPLKAGAYRNQFETGGIDGAPRNRT